MPKVVTILSVICVHALNGAPPGKPTLVDSGPISVNRLIYIKDSTVTRTSFSPYGSLQFRARRPSRQLPEGVQKYLLLGELAFKTELVGQNAGDQALFLENTYLEARIKDQTKSRALDQIKGAVFQSKNETWISGSFDAKLLESYLSESELDHLRLVISVRQYDWFGRGKRLESVDLSLGSLLEQLSKESSVSVTLPESHRKIEFSFAAWDLKKSKGLASVSP